MGTVADSFLLPPHVQQSELNASASSGCPLGTHERYGKQSAHYEWPEDHLDSVYPVRQHLPLHLLLNSGGVSVS